MAVSNYIKGSEGDVLLHAPTDQQIASAFPITQTKNADNSDNLRVIAGRFNNIQAQAAAAEILGGTLEIIGSSVLSLSNHKVDGNNRIAEIVRKFSSEIADSQDKHNFVKNLETIFRGKYPDLRGIYPTEKSAESDKALGKALEMLGYTVDIVPFKDGKGSISIIPPGESKGLRVTNYSRTDGNVTSGHVEDELVVMAKPGDRASIKPLKSTPEFTGKDCINSLSQAGNKLGITEAIIDGQLSAGSLKIESQEHRNYLDDFFRANFNQSKHQFQNTKEGREAAEDYVKATMKDLYDPYTDDLKPFQHTNDQGETTRVDFDNNGLPRHIQEYQGREWDKKPDGSWQSNDGREIRDAEPYVSLGGEISFLSKEGKCPYSQWREGLSETKHFGTNGHVQSYSQSRYPGESITYSAKTGRCMEVIVPLPGKTGQMVLSANEQGEEQKFVGPNKETWLRTGKDEWQSNTGERFQGSIGSCKPADNTTEIHFHSSDGTLVRVYDNHHVGPVPLAKFKESFADIKHSDSASVSLAKSEKSLAEDIETTAKDVTNSLVYDKRGHKWEDKVAGFLHRHPQGLQLLTKAIEAELQPYNQGKVKLEVGALRVADDTVSKAEGRSNKPTDAMFVHRENETYGIAVEFHPDKYNEYWNNTADMPVDLWAFRWNSGKPADTIDPLYRACDKTIGSSAYKDRVKNGEL